MMLRWLIAAVHLLALGIGLGAVVGRARALRTPVDEEHLKTAFFWDSLWGLSAVLWISTGIWRAFGGLEKGSAYYLQSTAFWIRMALLLAIVVLEVRPMIALIRWRRARNKGSVPDVSSAPILARISAIQAVLVVGMVLAATAMARGIGS